MLGQRDYSVFGQEGLHWRTRKDIGDLRLAKCSTLYSAVFNNVHSYISWGLISWVVQATKFMPHDNVYDYGIGNSANAECE